MTTTGTDSDAHSGGWHGHHLFLHSTAEDTDAFLLREAAPCLDGLVAAGEAARWFFIRYGEDGPHLRIRVRGLDAAGAARLSDHLAHAAKEVPAVAGPWPSAHGEVRTVPYVPETQRYGGARALPVAEEVFAASTEVTLEALRALDGAGGSARLAVAADLAHATAYALGMDPLAAARWLRGHAAGWRWVTEVPLLPGAPVHARVNSVYAAQRSTLVRRAAELRQRLADGSAAPWLNRWTERVREADAALRALGSPDAPDSREDAPAPYAWVWASQLHMLFNRLGVIPDEERAVCRLAARTLLETAETAEGSEAAPSYFPSSHTAPDVQYLERSKFQIGRGEDTALRPTAPLPRPAVRPAGPDIPLPTGPLPDVPLGAVLAGRASARGALGGPLDAETLGALLWHSLAESGRSAQLLADGSTRTLAHRPYPSAGALYTARVRLLVLGTDGVPAGTYDCVPESRTLRPVGPLPPLEEVKALSTYLSRPASDPDWIGIDAAPVVLGVYADVGLLRRRYGLRALRLALLETGHLTQTLLLTASALGLAGTPLGGFHDDLAQELLGLDDLDQPLQYLLPLGRRTGNPG
ncbi:thiopeptide-type bacteriocin biosynthesis protein [Streptomyces sp. NBC_00536]|uniref:thiopeptide-type bacteriocin biosynthesis protein n=1 Tax=Streptomyces sp. NBC_00536 TaxID=2975769 RepID=UPI002E809967|nr:thiopeptide-type bacteriocin biosynthesis protein [Streptomyces sp. NBC_00536]WUC82890.1 thiopeptide-type bacteriocin biosynthesis protein [Streptomyces sp. NBC_00536]